MARTSNFALRLQGTLLDDLKKAAAKDGASVNQFINVAVAEKLATLRTIEFFRERAAKADFKAFDEILARAGSEPPREGDELPENFEQSEFNKRLEGAKK